MDNVYVHQLHDGDWCLLCALGVSTIKVDKVRWIVEELGANVDAVNPFSGYSALMMAIQAGNREAAAWLAERVEAVDYVNAQDESEPLPLFRRESGTGGTALLMAIRHRMFAVARTLIERGADILREDAEGMSVVDWIDHINDPDLVKLIKAAQQERLRGSGGTDSPLAVRLFDPERVEREIEQEQQARRKHLLKQLQDICPDRALRTLPEAVLERTEALRAKFPNFGAAIDVYVRHLSLCRLSADRVIALPPVLLAGEPGTGKTRFSMELAKILGLEFTVVACSTLTAGWIIAGGSTCWAEGKPGMVAKALRDGASANPLILMDEIDKVAGDQRYDPMGALYTLLEKNTARRFVDEALEIPFDASHVCWIATANDVARIPDPILSRLVVVHIPAPDRNQMKTIVRSIYADILDENATWSGSFDIDISDEVIGCLLDSTPRKIKQVLIDACGRAVTSRDCDRYRLLKEDLLVEMAKTKNKVGFT